MNDAPQAPPGPIFPRWFDRFVKLLGLLLAGGVVFAVFMLAYAGSPSTLNVGYQPDQPVAYSHRLHAGELGIDCRYCHDGVESSSHAAVPPTATCMNCHATVRTTSEKLAPVFSSHRTGLPIRWVRVHDLPDYAYFSHEAHVRRGVGCVSCHGRVDRMEVVYQHEPLSMGWCLDCHRDPAPWLRPPEAVTKMDWMPDGDARETGERIRRELGVDPSTDCSTCHR
ncbi:MAG: cytochrome c family protein [Planctomycetes bacterium]|jgi:hypothetical protein|nr:cytochrome c family protein [Planctomycetota bacterium]